MRKLITLALLIVLIISCKNENVKQIGLVFGTSYTIQYYGKSSESLNTEIDTLFYDVDKSMSTYDDSSLISKINRNEAFEIDTYFATVLDRSKEIYKETEGAFDPTIGNLVNAWDFGSEGRIVALDSLKIDSLMQFVGLNMVSRKGYVLKKQNPNTYLDFNAIAKGYGVDVISNHLERKGIDNFIVEIGGEIRTKGINVEKNQPWKVGVEMPHFDGSRSIIRAISLKDKSMATSGTYRKFKIDTNGNKYSHIIDTNTGYPSKTSLLSISVIAEDCMTADAYATAFKTMGIEKIKTFLKSHPELQVFLIFENENKELENLSLNGFPES